MKRNNLYEGTRLKEWLLFHPECAKEIRNYLPVLEKNHFEFASYADESTPANPDIWRVCSKIETGKSFENYPEYVNARMKILELLRKHSVDAVSFQKNEIGNMVLFRLFTKGGKNVRL